MTEYRLSTPQVVLRGAWNDIDNVCDVGQSGEKTPSFCGISWRKEHAAVAKAWAGDKCQVRELNCPILNEEYLTMSD